MYHNGAKYLYAALIPHIIVLGLGSQPSATNPRYCLPIKYAYCGGQATSIDWRIFI